MEIPDLSIYTSIAFIAVTILTFWLFWRASKYSKKIFWLFITWLLIHGILAYTGFYQNTAVRPPRILLTFFPAIIVMLVLFFSKKGKEWIRQLDAKMLTLLHVVRIPVELVLYFLFLNGAVPELMTFAGRNFDILAGITAPFVYYFGFVKKILKPKVILLWNVICLGLLLFVVANALLSAPLPFQKFAFEQPNIAVFCFPFIWLPAFVVPVVLFSHLVIISRTKGEESI